MKMVRYSMEPRTKKYVKWSGFWSFMKDLSNKFGGKLLGTATKAGVNALKTGSKRVFHKTAEATGEFVAYKIADKIVKSKLFLMKSQGMLKK